MYSHAIIVAGPVVEENSLSVLGNIDYSNNGSQTILLHQKFRDRRDRAIFLGTVFAISCFICLYRVRGFASREVNNRTSSSLELSNVLNDDLIRAIGGYNNTDFVNEKGVSLPYWDSAAKDFPWDDTCQQSHREQKSVAMKAIPFGPCYLPSPSKNIVRLSNGRTDNSIDDKVNQCRPGFIIIGAGKCGTSSLYQYITGHPRVMPAKEKQIHYFKNATDRPMSWYLSHFPSAEDFLSHRALITGEASPGYLVRPNVAFSLQHLMRKYAGNGQDESVSVPKIITAVRNPLERSWSSYNYNYVHPTLDKIKEEYSVAVNMTDEEIQKRYLFSFEQMVKAELDVLKECLKPYGQGESETKRVYGDKDWAVSILRQKEAEGIPLVAIDEFCYGEIVSQSLPRRQWKKLVEEHPEKVIYPENLHVVQSIVGRSLYTLSLEWWYALYPRSDLHLVCSEDLKYSANEELAEVSEFLGLPDFDFTEVVSKGMYNVGENRGYYTATSWSSASFTGNVTDQIPLSKDMKEEFLSFTRPYNERLYKLVGKRCNWW